MSKFCSTKDLLVRYDRDILVWHHIINNYTLNYPIILSNRLIILNNISNIRPPLPPIMRPVYLVIPTRGHVLPRAIIQVENQEALRKHNRGHDLSLKYDI